MTKKRRGFFMELKKNNIIETTSSNIFKKYSMLINALYNEYLFLDMPRETFNKLVISIIEKTKEEYDDEIVYSSYLKKKICEELVKYINDRFKDNREVIKIVNSFVKIKFHGPKNDEYIIFYLTKLNEFFNSLNYVPNPDVIIDIVSHNKLLNEIIGIYVNNNLNKVKAFGDDILKDNVVALIIDAYCEIYHIDKYNSERENYNITLDKSITTSVDSLKVYFNEIKNIPPLTIQEEEKYVSEMLKGSESAKEMLIRHNLKLVVIIARRYLGLGMSLNDLIQDGNEGLIVAASKYDARKQYRFTSYACWWIKQRIIRSLTNNSRTIRIPESVYIRNSKYQIEFSKLQNELGRIPTDREIAEYMGISIFEVSKIRMALGKTLSLNDKIFGDNEDELSELVAANDNTMEENTIITSLPKEIMHMFNMCGLKEKEIKLLTLRYGLNGGEPQTLQDTGRELGNISKERVRQLEAIALKKIRMSPYIKDFAIYMDEPDSALKRIDDYRKEYAENVLNSNTLKLSASIDNGKARGYNVVREPKYKTKTR